MLFAKKATEIGVYYDIASRKIKHIKVPDYDWELDDPRHIGPGEALMRLPISFGGKPTKRTLDWYVKEAEKVIP